MVEWDRVGLHNDHGLVTHILIVLYIISKRWGNIGEGKLLYDWL